MLADESANRLPKESEIIENEARQKVIDSIARQLQYSILSDSSVIFLQGNESDESILGSGTDLPAFFGPPITGEQRQSAWLSRSRVLLGQREPASPASAHRHPSQHGAAL